MLVMQKIQKIEKIKIGSSRLSTTSNAADLLKDADGILSSWWLGDRGLER